MLYDHVEFANGDILSIQAGPFHYCTPREDFAEAYTTVEVGNINHIELPSRWEAYAEAPFEDSEFTVYCWVPAVLVHELIKSKGGIIDGEIPPLAVDTYNQTVQY